MSDTLVYKLADIAQTAQQKFQQQNGQVDPIIGISSNLRKRGFGADILTIDTLNSKLRLLFLVADDQPDQVGWLVNVKKQEPSLDFQYLPVQDFTEDRFLALMTEHLA